MSIDVKQRGSAWRACVRVYGYPTKLATFDTHREAHDWAVITHGEFLAKLGPGRTRSRNQPNHSQPGRAIQSLFHQF